MYGALAVRSGFGVTCFGSWLAYYLVAIAGAMGFAGVGLAISSRTEMTLFVLVTACMPRRSG